MQVVNSQQTNVNIIWMGCKRSFICAYVNCHQSILRGGERAGCKDCKARGEIYEDVNRGKQKVWWRRRESNPRPKVLLVKRLHAYSRSCPRHYPGTFAAHAQNGQETRSASLKISSSLPRRSREDQPAVRRPSEAHGQNLLERLPKLVRLRMPSVDWQLSFCTRLRVCAPRHASWP